MLLRLKSLGGRIRKVRITVPVNPNQALNTKILPHEQLFGRDSGAIGEGLEHIAENIFLGAATFFISQTSFAASRTDE